MTAKDWKTQAANEIADLACDDPECLPSAQRAYRAVIDEHCPFKDGVVYEPASAEPMNLRLFKHEDVWFIRGFGYTGHGPSPELAIRDLVLHWNTNEPDKWPLVEPPLLICVNCKNTESPAGAMARQFNHGLCMYCHGPFKVFRA